MSKSTIQKLIDDEKPAFDYARMFLTVIAWWTMLIVVVMSIINIDRQPSILLYIIASPVLILGGLFGVFLLMRINALTEEIVGVLLNVSEALPAYLRFPSMLAVILLPLASAWLIVWVLTFPNFAG